LPIFDRRLSIVLAIPLNLLLQAVAISLPSVQRLSARRRRERGVPMPSNGEINNCFGVYKTVCCGSEIVIAEGAKFPDCPKHPTLSTEWKSIDDEPIGFGLPVRV
jgi:hypothetical protein